MEADQVHGSADELVLAVRRATHDLNNALGVIRNFTELTRRRIGDHPAAEELRIVDEATTKAVALVAELQVAATDAAKADDR